MANVRMTKRTKRTAFSVIRSAKLDRVAADNVHNMHVQQQCELAGHALWLSSRNMGSLCDLGVAYVRAGVV